jgi:hypothetical protein
MKDLKVLLISDGKGGHVTQSQGVINYLGEHFVIEQRVLQVKPKIKIANNILRRALNKKWRNSYFLFSLLYSFDKELVRSRPAPDLVISTGGNTCGANAVMAEKFQCCNFYLGSLRGHLPNFFSSIITSNPTQGIQNNIVLEVMPTLVSYEKMREAGDDFLKKQKIKTNKELWIMLIGGGGSGYEFSKEDYLSIATSMLKLAKKYNINWLLTTSRRTGLRNEQYLKKILTDNNLISHAVYFNEKPEKVMLAYLGAASIVFCTEDSTSMVSEALVSQKPVFTLRGKTKNLNKGHVKVIERFIKHHYVSRVMIRELEDLNPEKFEHQIVDVKKNYDLITKAINDKVFH